MPKIHILPESVINQIAAGEVIERPASIIKELIENSIDAGAKRIIINFSEGGMKYLSISDDGCGISSDDLKLAFTRSATSKIQTIKDLDTISTFGFRGEAMASISAVAQVICRSKTQQDTIGTEISFDSGKFLYQKPYSCNTGTTIEIRNLFEKLPARRLFLKSVSTETGHIIKTIKAFIISNPDVYFEIRKDNKLLIISPSSKEISKRITALYGEFGNFIDIKHEDDNYSISGVLFEPTSTTKTKPEFLIFIQNRQVSSLLIYRTVKDAIQMSSYDDISIGACLFLTPKKTLIDFNVHPQKKEVRFKNEHIIKRFLENAIMNAYQKFLTKNNIANFNHNTISHSQNNYNTQCTEQDFDDNLPEEELYKNIKNKITQNLSHINVQSINNSQNTSWTLKKPVQMQNLPFHITESENTISKFEYDLHNNATENTFQQQLSTDNHATEHILLPSNWKLINRCYNGQCIMFESANDLIIISISALVKFVTQHKILSQTNIASQLLLNPLIINIPNECEEDVEYACKTFKDFGIELEKFGKKTYKVRSLPNFISEDAITNMLHNFNEINHSKTIQKQAYAKWICRYISTKNISHTECIQLLNYCYEHNLYSLPDFDRTVIKYIQWKDVIKNI